jgi:uncharacterized glyoxalase superfamily protein PhnB
VYAAVKQEGFQMNIVKDIETHWYGLREFKMCDPDGYSWTFNTPTERTEEGEGESAGEGG